MMLPAYQIGLRDFLDRKQLKKLDFISSRETDRYDRAWARSSRAKFTARQAGRLAAPQVLIERSPVGSAEAPR